MKKHRGLTPKCSLLLHGIQQLSAFLSVFCFALLVLYSFVVIRVNSNNYYSDKLTYTLDLFSGENQFEDTATFDDMLMVSVKEIIRYNVAKSQLEVDGKFDSSKLIDIKAFINRKQSRQQELPSVASSEIQIMEAYDADSYHISSYSTTEDSAVYTLEDLLKWDRYGMTYETIDMSEKEFLLQYPEDMERVEFLYEDGENITDGERTALLGAYMGSYSASGETYQESYDVIYSDEAPEKATAVDVMPLENLLDRETEEWMRNMQDGKDTGYELSMHRALAQLLMEGDCGIQGIYIDRGTGEIWVRVLTLTERYKPQNENSLLLCADSWQEYQTMVSYVERTVQDLSYNYNEYLDFTERYGEGATNIFYTFQMRMMGESVEVSNLPQKVEEDQRDSYFKSKFGKYIIYSPQNMALDTNTGIKQPDTLFHVFSAYEYAYPESGKIWIAVDTRYPAEDALSKAASAYSFLHPVAYVVCAIAVFSLILWVVLFLFLSVQTGYVRENGEDSAVLSLNWFDQIPTEILLVPVPLVLWCLAFLCSMRSVTEYASESGFYLAENRMQSCLAGGGIALLCSLLFSLCWYSFLRRCKAHTLWKNSLLGRFFQMVKKPLLHIYDHFGTWIRLTVLLGGIMFMNFLMGIFFYRNFYYMRLRELLLLFLFGIVVIDGGIVFLWFMNQIKRKRIIDGISKIRDGDVSYQVDTTKLHGENLQLAEAVNSIGEGIKLAVETSMKDERLKADLITNVSHDIKTPLTSIINYVDLLKREKIETEPVKTYIGILDAKSQRLKQLTDDLVEASKISSGNITLYMEKINLTELLNQSVGEFSERFAEKNLTLVDGFSGEAVYIEADSRRIWRVVENLFANICKYALPGTRVYLDMELLDEGKWVGLSLKNISAQPLNIKADELTERFIRGDVSRSTEGSGLGLSIAKNLTTLQNGKFDIYLDGDLFKVQLRFPVYTEQ